MDDRQQTRRQGYPFVRPQDLDTLLPAPAQSSRKPGTPIVRLIAEDLITDDQVKGENAWRPKKVGVVERTSKNAVVAWTSKIGWCVYAQNNTTAERAFYMYEAIDDPHLSARLMVGVQEE